MAYLIDANCFIEPFKRYYGFEVCPGYWDWLDQQYKLGTVYSIDKIYGELTKLSDDLSVWAKKKDPGFFLKTDVDTMKSYTQIVNWVNSAAFTAKAKSKFMAGADPFLIAYALAHGHAVITDEIHEPKRKNKVKIPAVCLQFHVPYMHLHDFLKSQKAKFTLN